MADYMIRRNTETASCVDCAAPFQRIRRRGTALSGLPTRCTRCRPAHKAALQRDRDLKRRQAADARLEREQQQRDVARLHRFMHPPHVGQCERSHASLARQIAGMDLVACVNCGIKFPARKTITSPLELCCLCALKSVAPIPQRWSGEHPLSRNV